MENPIEKFLLPFENKIRENIIEFGKRLAESRADFYILMARKAACFISCLESLSLTEINGFVTTERVLDMNTEYLKNKKIIIVDDTIVSGSTLNRTIRELNRIQVRSIDVMVMAVNRDWYSYELLKIDGEDESYVRKPYLILENQECIKQCSDIVKSISLIPRPYDIDFPLFTNVKITNSKLKEIIQFYEWDSDDTSSLLQHRNEICTITLSPRRSAKRFFNEAIGFRASELCVLKIRLYCKIPHSDANSTILRVVPFALLHPLGKAEINRLFNGIIINSQKDRDFFYKEFKSANSKLRFIQYIISAKLAKFWSNSLTEVFGLKQNVVTNLLPPKFLFSPFVLDDVIELSTKDYSIKLFRDIKKATLRDSNINKDLSAIEYDNDLISIQTKLTEPFLQLFLNKEIPARKLVKEYGKDAFDKDEYKVLDRLNSGFSFLMLHGLIDNFQDDLNTMKIVSLFLDKGIDAGVVVPTNTVTDDGIYFRAFRHGEDVQFGEEEEKLCYILLKTFSENSGYESLPHFIVEKLLVLLLQIGTQNGFLDPFISNTPTSHSVACVKYYLHGPVVTYNPIVNIGEDTGPSFLNEDRTSNWIPHILKKKDILKKKTFLKGPNKKPVSRYQVGNAPSVLLDFNKEANVENLGLIMGYLIGNKGKPRLNASGDLIALTACLQPTQIAPALAAELTIFSSNWDNFFTTFKSKSGNTKHYLGLASLIRKPDKVFFTAMDSGYKKFIAFMEKTGHKLIDRVTKEFPSHRRVESNNWRTFWSQNGEWEKDSIHKDLWKNIIDSGLWLLSANIYVRIVELCLRCQAIVTQSNQEENNEACKKIVNRLIELEEKLILYSKESEKRASDIIPYIRDFLNGHCSENRIDYKWNMNFCLTNIKKLIFLSRQICNETELIVKPFGEPLSIEKFQHALFLDIDYKGGTYKESNYNIDSLIQTSVTTNKTMK